MVERIERLAGDTGERAEPHELIFDVFDTGIPDLISLEALLDKIERPKEDAPWR